MSEDYSISYKDYKDLETSTRFVKWMCVSILAVLVSIYLKVDTATTQNHHLKIDLLLLEKTVSDHLLEQKDKNASIIKFLTDHERDKRNRKKKEEYYANDGNG